MGNSNEVKKLPQNDPEIMSDISNKNANKNQQAKAKQPSSSIKEETQQTQYKLPQDLKNRQKVRTCINKYNDKVDLQMKKQYVKDFFSMREKLLNSMQATCKQSYPVPRGNVGRELKQCMQSVQMLISEEDERMQVQFGTKLFLLADKCLIKEERALNKSKESDKLKSNNVLSAKKQSKNIVDPVDKCVDKLLKYRNLNMEMHILKLQLAREML